MNVIYVVYRHRNSRIDAILLSLYKVNLMKYKQCICLCLLMFIINFSVSILQVCTPMTQVFSLPIYDNPLYNSKK